MWVCVSVVFVCEGGSVCGFVCLWCLCVCGGVSVCVGLWGVCVSVVCVCVVCVCGDCVCEGVSVCV